MKNRHYLLALSSPAPHTRGRQRNPDEEQFKKVQSIEVNVKTYPESARSFDELKVRMQGRLSRRGSGCV